MEMTVHLSLSLCR